MEKPIVPVYLNQRLVFDLLAMLQGGISTVTSVTKTETAGTSGMEKAKAAFGLSQALSTLLKIDLSGEKESRETTNHSDKFSEERVHTPASLFYRLRGMLQEKDLLQKLDQAYVPTSGDLIEFSAVLKRNPILEAIGSLSEMMTIAMLFDDSSSAYQKSKNKPTQDNEWKKMKTQMDAFVDALKAGNTTDLKANNLVNDYTAVITVETEFLNDPAMSDLVDGNFNILGKVIRAIEDENDSISLIRKTAFGKMPPHVLLQAFGALGNLGSEHGFVIPDMTWEVTGPAIQVIPVAIYA